MPSPSESEKGWSQQDPLAGTLPLRGVTLLGIAAVAAALAAATAGTLRVVGRGASLAWFVAGVLGGTVLVWLR